VAPHFPPTPWQTPAYDHPIRFKDSQPRPLCTGDCHSLDACAVQQEFLCFYFRIPSPRDALLTSRLPEAHTHYRDPQATGFPSLLWQQEHEECLKVFLVYEDSRKNVADLAPATSAPTSKPI